MDDASGPGPARYANGRFGPGHTGRPRGARNRISRRVALSLLRHYEANEADVLHRLAEYHVKDYMGLIGRMLPRASDEVELEAVPPEEAARVTGAVRAALERVEAGEGSLVDIEAALMGEALDDEAP